MADVVRSSFLRVVLRSSSARVSAEECESVGRSVSETEAAGEDQVVREANENAVPLGGTAWKPCVAELDYLAGRVAIFMSMFQLLRVVVPEDFFDRSRPATLLSTPRSVKRSTQRKARIRDFAYGCSPCYAGRRAATSVDEWTHDVPIELRINQPRELGYQLFAALPPKRLGV